MGHKDGSVVSIRMDAEMKKAVDDAAEEDMRKLGDELRWLIMRGLEVRSRVKEAEDEAIHSQALKENERGSA